jgi:hypothetical protein
VQHTDADPDGKECLLASKLIKESEKYLYYTYSGFYVWFFILWYKHNTATENM